MMGFAQPETISNRDARIIFLSQETIECLPIKIRLDQIGKNKFGVLDLNLTKSQKETILAEEEINEPGNEYRNFEQVISFEEQKIKEPGLWLKDEKGLNP